MRRDAAGRGSRGSAGRIRRGRARQRSAGARTRSRRPLGPSQSGADRKPAVRIPARRDRDPARQRHALSAGVRRPGETHARSTDRAARHRSCCALRSDEQRRDRRRNGLARNRARLDTRSRGARRIAGRRGPLRRGAPQSQEAADRLRQRPRKRIHAADPHACQCPGQAGRCEARTQSRGRLSQARRGAFCARAGGSQRRRRTRCARGSPQGRTAAAGLGGGRPARSATAAEGLGGSGRIVAWRLSEKISCGAGNAPRLRALAGGAKTLWRGARRVPEAHGRRSRQHRRGLRGGAAFPAAQGLRRCGEVSQEPDRKPLPRQGRSPLVSGSGRRRAEESSGGAALVRRGGRGRAIRPGADPLRPSARQTGQARRGAGAPAAGGCEEQPTARAADPRRSAAPARRQPAEDRVRSGRAGARPGSEQSRAALRLCHARGENRAWISSRLPFAS